MIKARFHLILRTSFAHAVFQSRLLKISGLLFPILLAGCGGGTFTGSKTAPTVTISASPTSIAAGKSSTLTVAATNATTVTVTGSDGSSYSLSTTGGTQTVTPTAPTTTYTATAAGVGGSANATATVTVTAATLPTVAISAAPATVVAGSSSTLTVAATNATTVTIAGSDNTSYTLAANGGTQVVTPSATTTYTATAQGAGGTATATAVVTVTAATVPSPTIAISAAPATVVAGSSSVLTVTATNATTVTIAGSDKTSYTLAATGGTLSVTPAATTTYTATAKGAGGVVTATATVTVTAATGPSSTITISASPTAITAGSSSTLTVSATNATAVTVTGSDNTSYMLLATGGTQSVSPTVTTTYTATATGPGGTATATTTVTVSPNPAPTVTMVANPTTITPPSASTLLVTVANASSLIVTGTDNSSYTLDASTPSQSQSVTPTVTTTYTATATGPGGTSTATATVTIKAAGTVAEVNHVIFMLQENHSFDNYFGMLNPYRKNPNGTGTCPNNAAGVPQCWNVGDDGNTYDVDGIDDKLSTTLVNDQGTEFPLFKLKSTCVDDESSDWLSSFGDVNRYDFTTTRKISQNGFVHTAQGYATSCAASGKCTDGVFSDTAGQRAMGYYDQGFLNYYYYMASQYALSDRWFSPVASKSIDNRIATFSGGTTQGLVKDPGGDDHLSQLALPSIFQALDKAKVSWKIYYTVTAGFCSDEDDCPPGAGPNDEYPATDFENFTYSFQYIHKISATTPTCTAPTMPSGTAVGDPTNSFCIDTDHIAPIKQYYADVAAGTLPSFAFIEAGYGKNDEHPGSGNPILVGQVQVAKVINAFTSSPSYADSIFFLAYDEGGGPYDHVPPVPNHSNDYTDATYDGQPMAANYPDVSSIAVNPDPAPNQTAQTNPYFPCVPVTPGAPTVHCDLGITDPGANADDDAAVNGFGAQVGFRLPNFVISPFARRHYVSHIPMDHTAVLKFVEDRFIGNGQYLTKRDAAQPNLLDFFDFTNIPMATPPTPPTPYTDPSGTSSCTPAAMQ